MIILISLPFPEQPRGWPARLVCSLTNMHTPHSARVDSPLINSEVPSSSPFMATDQKVHFTVMQMQGLMYNIIDFMHEYHMPCI